MKIVFFGNSKYSVIVAQALNKKYRLSLVVTIPDKLKGRQKQPTPSPTKEFAQKHKIPVLISGNLDQKTLKEIAKLKPDFLLVADYGLILPKDLLSLPKFAPLNVHHSLLPKYRGPSPAPAAILNGETKSGVTIINMTEHVDAGDILAQKEYRLKDDETTDSLLTFLNAIGAKILIEVIENYLKGKVAGRKQNHSQATYTHRYKKQDGYIDPQNPPDRKTLDRMIRAFYPWPGVWCLLTVHGRLFTIKFLPRNLIQPEGKRPMTVTEFKNGYPDLFKQISKLFTTE